MVSKLQGFLVRIYTARFEDNFSQGIGTADDRSVRDGESFTAGRSGDRSPIRVTNNVHRPGVTLAGTMLHLSLALVETDGKSPERQLSRRYLTAQLSSPKYPQVRRTFACLDSRGILCA